MPPWTKTAKTVTTAQQLGSIIKSVRQIMRKDKGILGNFPQDKRTAETALLFLQLIMRRLHRPGHGCDNGGRAGVVVPNGTLYGGSILRSTASLRSSEYLGTDLSSSPPLAVTVLQGGGDN